MTALAVGVGAVLVWLAKLGGSNGAVSLAFFSFLLMFVFFLWEGDCGSDKSTDKCFRFCIFCNSSLGGVFFFLHRCRKRVLGGLGETTVV